MKYLFAVIFCCSALPAALACSLCGSLGDQKTFRQDAQDSKLILLGTLEKSELTAGGAGVTTFLLNKALKNDPVLGDQKKLTIPRYIPIDPKKGAPRYLLFVDVFKGKLDFFRGVPISSDQGAQYVQGLISIDAKDRLKLLLHCFSFLESEDKEIAFDAFIELAKATDQEIGQLAGKLDPAKLRAWVKNPKTPRDRLGLYAYLLGGSGSDADAALLRSMLEKPTEDLYAAFDGILDGYIQLKPQQGWDLAQSLLRDEKQSFQVRFAVIRALRFFHNYKPDEHGLNILACEKLALAQGDLADLAIADLTRWKAWDLTPEILALYGKKTHQAPIVKRALVRYALVCPKPAAAEFIQKVRQENADIVADVEEGLQLEKK